jgi:uncharacterized protein YbjT (DUF2867 family)
MRTALVIGATGLVGGELVQLLLKDTRIERVKIFVRRSSGSVHPKLDEFIVNFDEPDAWKKYLTGDVLYSAMGTTLKAAGSKQAQYRIDHTYQYQTAKAAADNGVKGYVLISAAGADTRSHIFYSRMKGELERDVKKLPFDTIHILRPGMLAGHRPEARTGEQLGITIMSVIGHLPGLSMLKPIQGRDVARAMINASFRHVVGIHTYNMGQVFKLAERTNVVDQSKVLSRK